MIEREGIPDYNRWKDDLMGSHDGSLPALFRDPERGDPDLDEPLTPAEAKVAQHYVGVGQERAESPLSRLYTAISKGAVLVTATICAFCILDLAWGNRLAAGAATAALVAAVLRGMGRR